MFKSFLGFWPNVTQYPNLLFIRSEKYETGKFLLHKNFEQQCYICYVTEMEQTP